MKDPLKAVCFRPKKSRLLSGFFLARFEAKPNLNKSMHYILFDDSQRDRLLPLTHTRPVAELFIGLWTQRQRWERYFEKPSSTLTLPHLQSKYPLIQGEDNRWVNASLIATPEVWAEINRLNPGEKLLKGHQLLAARSQGQTITRLEDFEAFTEKQSQSKILLLHRLWDLFQSNDEILRMDFDMQVRGRTAPPIPKGVTVIGDHYFFEEGARIAPGTILNTETGPIYLDKDAEIMEGCLIRGPLALGPGAVVKMGAKIYGATSIGPGSKVGGELNNVLFFAQSNKSHDGFLGNSVIGQWCNLGADTNCSNLKNNYDEIKIWDESLGEMVSTGTRFMGLIMGDHSKCGINTMFNTGTVVGVSCNLFGGGFPDKFIPSFSWGGADKLVTYRFEKALQTAERMMARRHQSLHGEEIELYRRLYEATESQRKQFTKK